MYKIEFLQTILSPEFSAEDASQLMSWCAGYDVNAGWTGALVTGRPRMAGVISECTGQFL